MLSGVRMPHMNSIMERWVQTCRHELLDRTLIWNHNHLLRALREFEHFYNEHRHHQGIANTRPLHPLPTPIADPGQTTHLDIRRRDRLGGRHLTRVPACRLTSMDEVFGKRSVGWGWQFGAGMVVSGCCGGPVLVGDAAEDRAAADTVFGEIDRCGWCMFGLFGASCPSARCGLRCA